MKKIDQSLIRKLEAKIYGNYSTHEAYGRGLDSGFQVAIDIIRQHEDKHSEYIQSHSKLNVSSEIPAHVEVFLAVAISRILHIGGSTALDEIMALYRPYLRTTEPVLSVDGSTRKDDLRGEKPEESGAIAPATSTDQPDDCRKAFERQWELDWGKPPEKSPKGNYLAVRGEDDWDLWQSAWTASRNQQPDEYSYQHGYEEGKARILEETATQSEGERK